MKASLAAASLLALMLASPCMAVQEAAPPPMTTTHVNGKAANPLVERVESDVQSMVLDVAAVVMSHTHGLGHAPPPPPGYDRPYKFGIEVVEVRDPEIQQAMLDEHLVEFTPLPAKGQPCKVYVWPLWHVFVRGDDILLIEPVGLDGVMRHALGHCHGLVHPKGGTSDQWTDARKPTMPPHPASKPQREATNPDRHPRSFSGDGY
jgi:hypothetical protein